MLKQNLSHKLLQKLSPQQIQLMKLLQVPTVELEQRIKEELEVNPALDEGLEDEEEFENPEERDQNEPENDFDISDYLDEGDTPDYKMSVKNQGLDDDDKSVPLGAGKSFQEVLTAQIQLRKLTDKEKILAKTIIGNLDDSGYLRRELPAIVNDLIFSQNLETNVEELEVVLQHVQALDPSGVGARNLKECLLIQMRRKDQSDKYILLAQEILENYFDEFTKKHYDKIIKKLDVSVEDLKEAIQDIVKLNPKPGNSMKESSKIVVDVVPDFILVNENDKLSIRLNQRNAPDLKVSRQYKEMLKTYSEGSKKDKKQKEAVMFVKQKIDSAKWFIDAIKQRQHTLLTTMDTILKFQEEYFRTGDETKLNPMILKDIAEIIDMDISTVSRVANSKYIQTPYGTKLLKSFFSESLSTDTGEEVSTRKVKRILKDSVESEEKKKPLTDEKLAQLLKAKGFNIARRTVAKYREQLGIPVARLRKSL